MSSSSNPIPRTRKRPVRARIHLALLSAALCLSPLLHADSGMGALKERMQKQMKVMKPELRERIQSLSMDTRLSLMSLMAMHSRMSQQATMRQVMLEILHDYQGMVTGIMTESVELTADSARRLANHRIPKGGLLAYVGLDNITDEKLSTLESFNTVVEGGAKRIAEAAEAGDFATAATVLGEMAGGCVGCHRLFRESPPGKSPYVND